MSAPITPGTIGQQSTACPLAEIELLSETRNRAVVRVWARTPSAPVMNAEDHADERLGDDRAMTDWRAVA